MDVRIRLATSADAEAVLIFLALLATESEYTQQARLNRGHLEEQFRMLLENPDAGCQIAETAEGQIVGVLGFLLYRHLISGERGAGEVCWYVHPAWRRGLGRSLHAAAETWARKQGACFIQMLAPERKFEAYYRRCGYVPTDRVYERRLTCLG